MASAALQAFRRTVTVTWPEGAKEDARKALPRIAREGHAKIMREQTSRGSFTPDFEAYANHPGNPNLDSVKLPGPIVYKYHYLKEIIDFALKALRDASPVRSGKYRNSHTLYINGSPSGSAPSRSPPNAEIMLANPVPYSRRLEVGKTKAGRAFVIQVEPKIYERVMRRQLIPRYGQVAKFTYTFLASPESPAIVISVR